LLAVAFLDFLVAEEEEEEEIEEAAAAAAFLSVFLGLADALTGVDGCFFLGLGDAGAASACGFLGLQRLIGWLVKTYIVYDLI
jgi:hypothetical protein